MGTQENKQLSRRFLDEVINGGNVGLVDELTAPDFMEHQTPPGMPPTREGLKTGLTSFRAAFPDLHYTTQDEIAERDRVVTRATAHGTMKSDFAGMPASGKSATWEEIHITRYRDGKAVEHRGVVDQLGMMTQLGFVEAPGQPVGASR
jgi:steroid delta-isomerase-like uncharacterized protein